MRVRRGQRGSATIDKLPLRTIGSVCYYGRSKVHVSSLDVAQHHEVAVLLQISHQKLTSKLCKLN